KKFDYKSKAAEAAALEADDPTRELLRVYDHYPIASNAAECLMLAADRSFERGELERARRLYERLLRDHKAELKSPPQVREKALFCALFAGKRAVVEKLWAEAQVEDKDFRLHTPEKALTRDEVRELALKFEAQGTG